MSEIKENIVNEGSKDLINSNKDEALSRIFENSSSVDMDNDEAQSLVLNEQPVRDSENVLEKKDMEREIPSESRDSLNSLKSEKPLLRNTVYVFGYQITENFLKNAFLHLGKIVNISMEVEKVIQISERPKPEFSVGTRTGTEIISVRFRFGNSYYVTNIQLLIT